MAYFCNGETGIEWESKWCDRCLHRPENEIGDDCPIMTVHMLFNYDQHREGYQHLKDVLDILIPMDEVDMKHGTVKFPGDCPMFMERKVTESVQATTATSSPPQKETPTAEPSEPKWLPWNRI